MQWSPANKTASKLLARWRSSTTRTWESPEMWLRLGSATACGGRWRSSNLAWGPTSSRGRWTPPCRGVPSWLSTPQRSPTLVGISFALKPSRRRLLAAPGRSPAGGEARGSTGSGSLLVVPSPLSVESRPGSSGRFCYSALPGGWQGGDPATSLFARNFLRGRPPVSSTLQPDSAAKALPELRIGLHHARLPLFFLPSLSTLLLPVYEEDSGEDVTTLPTDAFKDEWPLQISREESESVELPRWVNGLPLADDPLSPFGL